MTFLNNIRTVARYEAKTLRRSWFFRLFSLGVLFIFTFMNIGVFSPVGDEDWELMSIPSSIPLINLYLLNIGQAIVVIFLAADFLKRDKKLDTNEVLYTRSMSNFEYVIGKTWGILRLFLGLDIIILCIGLLMNIISKSMTIDFTSYVAYLFIICIPTILFSLGLAFVLMSVIRNQAITFLLLLGIAAMNMFYLWFRLGSLFDYMAFGLPVFKSGMIGFDNPESIIYQRSLYFCLGAAMVMATILLFKRLPQSKIHRIITIVLLIVFMSGACVFAFITYSSYATKVKDKALVIETNRKFENSDFANITSCNIDLSHTGESIKATAEIVITNQNDKPLEQYIFSLNPSLKVIRLSKSGKEIKYSRINHIIDIVPSASLEQGKSDTLVISYEGSINESFCYPNFSDNIKESPYRIAMLNVNKRQAFLDADYVLLTPETHWYPVTALNYYPSNPARLKLDFSAYSLRVKDEEGLTAVSQGRKRSGEGYSTFKPEKPMTGITLAIGNYVSDTLKVDSVLYISHYFPGNNYYSQDLAELKDTLSLLVSGVMRELETNFSAGYPFKSLNLVQVPVQFHSYPRESTQTRSEVQPAMVLLPERFSTLQDAGFKRQFRRQKKNMARNNQIITDKELQVRLFNSFIRNTFINGNSVRFINGQPANEPVRYRLGPSFYFFKNNFYSSEYPVINAVFESHLQQVNIVGQRNYQYMAISDNDRANLILKAISFHDLLKKNPSADTIRSVLSVKGDWFFNLLRSKSGVENFNSWFSDYTDKNEFKSIDILTFNNDVKEKFGFDFYPYLRDWYYGSKQPAFRFGNLKVNQIVIGDRSRYQVNFTASNPEPVAGLFNISFRTGGPGGTGRSGGQMMMGPGGGGGGRAGAAIAMQGRGMASSDITKIVLLDSMEAKNIGVLLDFQPRAMMVNTLFSKNIPGQITLPVDEILKSSGNAKPFEGEERLPSIPRLTETNEIIVDNEDSGFVSNVQTTVSPLRKLLGADNKREETYQRISPWGGPEYWQPIVETFYYGDFIRSAVYTRAGTGDRMATWKTVIKEPGYYDIYCYIDKVVQNTRRGAGGPGNQGDQGGRGGPGGPEMAGMQRDENYKDLHYKVYHDEGVEDVTVEWENADGGWNNLGRYYLSHDTIRVELTNKSSGRIVIGDAIKWVKQE